MKNRNLPVDNNWITPSLVYEKINHMFYFDHDPCPYNTSIITPQTDGLNPDNKWGKSNFINPPYERKIKEAFVNRAIKEMDLGNTSVFLLPVSTSTVLFHDIIKKHTDEITFLKGRIKFQKRDQNGVLFTPKNGGMHDSMIVVFRGKCIHESLKSITDILDNEYEICEQCKYCKLINP